MLKLLNEQIVLEENNLLEDYISVLIFSKFYNISSQKLDEFNINEKYQEIFYKYENQESNEKQNKIFKLIGKKNILLNLKYDLIRKIVELNTGLVTEEQLHNRLTINSKDDSIKDLRKKYDKFYAIYIAR